MTTGGHPSTSLVSLDKITNTIPIDLFLREQAANCAARLKAQGNWELSWERTTNGRLQRHSSVIEDTLKSLPFNGESMDLTKPKLNLDANYSIAIPAREAYPDILDRLPASSIQCYTDGSKLEEKVGAGFVIYQNNTIIKEEALHLGAYSTVFQAETTAVLAAASYLLDTELKDKEITILCDSQATLMALDATKIRTRSIPTGDSGRA